MRQRSRWSFLCVSLLALMGSAANAASLIEEYTAYISERDLYNSSGERLSSASQIIRQDRANFHRFNNADPDDQSDEFFATADNRAALERMMRRGAITPRTEREIISGDVSIRVRIYRDVGGYYAEVEVIGSSGGNAESGPCFGVVAGLSGNYDPATGSGFLAVRSGPNASARQIGELFNGQRVEILDRRGSWLNVFSEDIGREGWIHRRWILERCP